MANQNTGSSSTPPGLPVFFYLLSLVLVITVRLGWSGVFVWGVLCYLGAERLFPRQRLRHVAGVLLNLFGAVTIIFLTAQGVRPLALLLFVPGAVLVGLPPLLPLRARRAVTNAPMTVMLLYVLGVLGLYGVGSTWGPLPSINDDFLFSLLQDEAPEPLSVEERLAAIDVIDAVLGGAQVNPASLPERLNDKHFGRVWVTLYRHSAKGRSVRGESPPHKALYGQLVLATRSALEQAASTKGWKQSDAVRVQVDLGGEETEIRPNPLRRGLRALVGWFTDGRPQWGFLVYRTEPGVVGFRMQGKLAAGVVLPADVVTDGLLTPRSRKKRYRTDNFAVVWDELSRRASQPKSEPGSRTFTSFRSYSFVRPVASERRTVEVFRGNVAGPAEVDERILLDAINRAGRWLLEQVQDDGRFDYQYYPTRDSHGRGYNEVRHAGSVYGLFHMADLCEREATLRGQRDAYLRAGILAMDRVYRNLGNAPGMEPDRGFVTFLEGKEGSKSNSGSPALTLLGFLMRPTPDTVKDETLRAGIWRHGDEKVMEGLAKTLLHMIDDEGKVYRYWREALEGKGVVKEPLYFPGEVMLALARYHEHTGDDVWLEGAMAIGRRQIRHAGKPWVVPDHWVMQALDLLDQADPDDTQWRDGAYAMGRRYIREQYPPQQPPFPDYKGAYRRIQEIPRTTRAASRGEAIGGVVRISWRHGDESWNWERSLLEGSRHLIEQMFTIDNSFFVPKPSEVLGAIRMGVVDNHCRIDNNQHAVVALSNALSALRHRRPGWGERGEQP